jgi:hypothetical protein
LRAVEYALDGSQHGESALGATEPLCVGNRTATNRSHALAEDAQRGVAQLS